MIAAGVSVPIVLPDSLTGLVFMCFAICEFPSVAPAPVELPLGVPFLAWEPADVEGAAAAPRFDEDGQEG